MQLKKIFAALSLPLLALLALPAQAQHYPSKPVRLLIGTAPGGAVDIVARIIAPRLSEAMGQPFVVEYRPGPYMAQKMIAESAPDGYTLMVPSTTITVSPTLYPDAGLDVKTSVGVARVADTPIVLVVRPGLPVKSVDDLIKLAREKPGKLTYGSAGNGTPPHLAAELFKNALHLNILHVPYKGVSPALVDLVAGRIDIMFTSYGSVVAFLKDGRVQPIAITNEHRIPQLPDTPTVGELGYPAATFGSWTGVIAPAKTPPAIVDALNREIVRIIGDKNVKENLVDQGFIPAPSTSQEFTDLIMHDTESFGQVIAKAGIKAN